MLSLAVPSWHSTLHQMNMTMCSEHAGIHIVCRYGRKAHAVVLLPSAVHLFNYDQIYVTDAHCCLIYRLRLHHWIVFHHRTGNTREVISSDILISAVIVTVITRHI